MRAVLERHADQNRFIHFSEVAKVGVNPQKRRGDATMHLDPYGVYTYSIDFLLEMIDGETVTNSQARRYLMDGGLFATGRDFYFIMEPTGVGDTLDLSKMTSGDVIALAKRNGWRGRWDDTLYGPKGQVMWRVLKAADQNRSLTWQQALKGVGMIYDPEGVIHPSEPGQAVFLVPKAFRVVDSGKNPDTAGTNSYSVDYWKDIIQTIFGTLAKRHAGRLYWKDKLPHVDITIDDVNLTVYMSEYSAIFIRYPKGDETAEYRCEEEVDLDEMTVEQAILALDVTAADLAKVSKLYF